MFQLPESWKINNRINEARSESFESWADKTRYLSEQARSDNVVRVLSFPEISPSSKQEMIKEFDYTHNLVTNDGEIYYAKMGAGETPASNEDFGGTGSGTGYFEMGTTAYTEAEATHMLNLVLVRVQSQTPDRLLHQAIQKQTTLVTQTTQVTQQTQFHMQ